jgi:hypothetical protein
MRDEYGERQDKKWTVKEDALYYKTAYSEIFEQPWTGGGEVVHVEGSQLGGEDGYVVEGILSDSTLNADTINYANQNRLEITILGEEEVREDVERPKIRIHPE